MRNKNTQTAKANTAKAVRISALEIVESYHHDDHDDLDMTSNLLGVLKEYIVTPETLNKLANLFNDIAQSAESIEGDHEAENCEAICEIVADSFSAKYNSIVGRG